jgi:D-glycero-alpha-D-manno-heptose-7-phosphate kinase
MKDALLMGRLTDFAELLGEEWKAKVRVNPNVTNDVIDLMYQTALKNGAIGGKLLGAGAGGYMLLFCETNKKRFLREKLEKFGGQFTEFSFINDGLRVWRSSCL